MNFEGYLHDLRRAEFYKGQIAHVEQIPARSAQYGALERPLAPALEQQLESRSAWRASTRTRPRPSTPHETGSM